MILTNQVRNAARLLVSLNHHEPTSMNEFHAANPDLSVYFMDQIARKLRRAGLITSLRGPGGGYYLANRNITMLDLIYCLGSERKARTDDLTIVVEQKLNEIVIAREERAHHDAAH